MKKTFLAAVAVAALAITSLAAHAQTDPTVGGAAMYPSKTIVENATHADPQLPWLAAATNRLPLIVRKVVPITTGEYPTPAQRPAYSVLSNARLAKIFQVQLPDWQTQLTSLYAERPGAMQR